MKVDALSHKFSSSHPGRNHLDHFQQSVCRMWPLRTLSRPLITMIKLIIILFDLKLKSKFLIFKLFFFNFICEYCLTLRTFYCNHNNSVISVTANKFCIYGNTIHVCCYVYINVTETTAIHYDMKHELRGAGVRAKLIRIRYKT